ncbi:MAG: iron-sulfur cluster repair di-iron protein [Melioribacter sp.]|nr:iron-sulfur cluster repair di-iron protein [Melioribacter sp.]
MKTETLYMENKKDYFVMKVKDIVNENFRTASLFENFGIDYCCNGNQILKEALEKNKISNDRFAVELNKVNQSTETPRYNEWDLIFLTQYIINNHHSYVRTSLPHITKLLQKLQTAHSSKYSYLADVQNIFSQVTDEMTSHMMKEERILFPLIKYLAETQKFNEKPKTGGFGTIKNPILQMEAEHVSAGSAMETIRTLTNNYTLPNDACTTFKITYKELDEFEKDLHKHVHLENNILFPRAIELEELLLKN